MIVDSPRLTTICFAVQHVLAAPYEELFEFERLSNASVLTAAKIQHYVFPGTLELLQLVFEVPNIQVAFFDDEDEEVTQEFVQMLLAYALGPDKHDAVRKSVHIWSKKDLTAETFDVYKQQKQYFGFNPNFLKKDVKRLLGVSTDVVLVDSNPSYLPGGKEAILLASPCVHASDYIDMEDSESGPEAIEFCFARFKTFVECAEHKKNVATSRYILLAHLAENNRYYTCFTKENSLEVLFYPFTEEECALLDTLKLREMRYSRQELQKISAHAVAMILTKITAYHGKIDRICRKANHIYFLAGAIFEALETAKEKQKSASGIYFSLQFQPINGKFKETFDKFHAEERLYYKGLALLQTKNPSLRFLHHESN